jgi:hypothetical protein
MACTCDIIVGFDCKTSNKRITINNWNVLLTVHHTISPVLQPLPKCKTLNCNMFTIIQLNLIFLPTLILWPQSLHLSIFIILIPLLFSDSHSFIVRNAARNRNPCPCPLFFFYVLGSDATHKRIHGASFHR